MTQAPIDENSTNRIASVYLAFAEREAHGRSALYETLARGVAGDSVALSFLAEFPRAKQQPNLLFAAVKYLYQLVAGFSRPVNLSATRDGPRFSGSTTQPGKVQLSGGSEWLETKVGAPFPRNWGWRSLNNLSYRIFPSAAVVRRQSWAFTRSSTTLCYCSIWAASGRSCRSKRMAKVALKFTTRASIAPGGGGRPMAVSTPFLPAQWCSCTGTTFSISRCFTAIARRRQPKRAAITSALAGTRR